MQKIVVANEKLVKELYFVYQKKALTSLQKQWPRYYADYHIERGDPTEAQSLTIAPQLSARCGGPLFFERRGNMMAGYVRLHRDITAGDLWLLEPFTKAQAWVDLFLKANWKPGVLSVRGNIVEVDRGQIGWSELTMSSRWKWSKGKVRRFLSYLEKTGNIVQQKSTITTLITICNYELYQADDTTEGRQTVQQTVQQKDSRRYTIEKGEEGKELSLVLKTEDSAPVGTGGKVKKDDVVESIYAAYPRKVAKGNAVKAIKKALTLTTPEELLSAVKAYALTRVGEDPQFTPHPASWFNGQRWLDVADKMGVDLSGMSDPDFWAYYNPFRVALNCPSLNGAGPSRKDAEKYLTNYLKQKKSV